MVPAPARRNQQVLPQIPRKALQDRMRPALRVHRLGQARVEALDRNGDSPHTPPRVVAGSPRIVAQELQHLLPLPPRHRVNRLRRWVQQQARDVQRPQFVFEDRLPAFKGQFPESQPSA